MALDFSTGLANAILDAIVNGGTSQSFFDSAILEIRSGAAPGTDQAPTGTLLASMTLPSDAMAAAASKAVALAGTWQDSSADATGTAAHFRIKKSGDLGTANTTDKRLEGTAGTSGTDLVLVTASVVATQPIQITAFSLSLPA